MEGDRSLCRNCGLAVFRVVDWSTVRDPYCSHETFAHVTTAMYCCGRDPHVKNGDGKIAWPGPWPADLPPPPFAEPLSTEEMERAWARVWADLERPAPDIP
jgi:hypothetical protein